MMYRTIFMITIGFKLVYQQLSARLWCLPTCRNSALLSAITASASISAPMIGYPGRSFCPSNVHQLSRIQIKYDKPPWAFSQQTLISSWQWSISHVHCSMRAIAKLPTLTLTYASQSARLCSCHAAICQMTETNLSVSNWKNRQVAQNAE